MGSKLQQFGLVATGLVAGVFLSLVLGVLIGGISGYYGGWIDALIQRSIGQRHWRRRIQPQAQLDP